MADDVIHRFSFADAPIRGQWVRLSGTLAEAFHHRAYPAPARRLLAEMLAAVSLMADGIKFQGTVALQARGDGAVSTALAECRDRHLLRGIVRCRDGHGLTLDAGSGAAALGAEPVLSTLLGDGQMVITLTPDTERFPDAAAYQGIVGLDDDSLSHNLEGYFRNSEQLPTRCFLGYEGGRVSGLLLQRLPASGLPSMLMPALGDEAWREVESLAESVRAEELSGLSLAELLRRLFHEHTITVHPARRLTFACTCSRDRVERMLTALPRAEVLALLQERGSVDVTCEICGARYVFDRVDTHLLYEPGTPRLH